MDKDIANIKPDHGHMIKLSVLYLVRSSKSV